MFATLLHDIVCCIQPEAYLCSADGGRDDYASLYGGETPSTQAPSTQQAQGGLERQTADVVSPAENGKAEHPSDSGNIANFAAPFPGYSAACHVCRSATRWDVRT